MQKAGEANHYKTQKPQEQAMYYFQERARRVTAARFPMIRNQNNDFCLSA